MAREITIGIVDSDPEHARELEKHIKTLDQRLVHVATVNNLEAAREMVAGRRPLVVLVELEPDVEEAFSFISKTQSKYPDTSFFAMSSDSSSDLILRAIRGGCTEFLLKPVDVKDMMNAFTKFGRLMIFEGSPRPEPNGSVIACFSPKGGMGNSTVAVNLAVELHSTTKRPVVLVDLDLESGDISMFLNLKTKYTISDVTTNISRLDKTYLEGVLTKHSSGVYFLSEPEKVEEASSITAHEVREVLELLKKMFTYVVVDTSTGYEEKNLVAFDTADVLLLVGVLSLPALHNLQKSLDVFERIGYNKNRVKLIINRYVRKSEITLEDAQKVLDYEVFWHLPNSYNDVMSSINRGMPLTQTAPNSEITRSFKELADATRDYVTKAPAKV